MPVRVTYAYAYSPRENTGSRGRVHAIAEQAVAVGRLVRQPGDALCTRKRFWGLDARTRERFERTPCPRCKALAERLGVEDPPVA